jgi:hypothetical protein
MVDLCSKYTRALTLRIFYNNIIFFFKYTRALTLRIVSHTCMYPPPHMTCMSCEEEDTCMRIVSHTHTHTHIQRSHIYIYMCVCVCLCVYRSPPYGSLCARGEHRLCGCAQGFLFFIFFPGRFAPEERTVLVAASKDFYRPFSNILYNIMYNIT